MTPYELDLAALSDGRYYAKRAEKPVKLKTDSGVTLEIPGPAVLAEVFALPWLRSRVIAYRSGSALLTRPIESDADPAAIHQGHLASELLAALQSLPERTSGEAGRPYRDLRLFLTEASPATRDGYLSDVVTHTRRLLPEWRPPVPRMERGPAKTAAERKATSRERIRREEEASTRDWLENFLIGWGDEAEAPAPGSRWIAAELYADAASVIKDAVEDAEDARASKEEPDTLPDGTPYRVPRQRVFYSVADELLGARRRGAKGSAMVYVIPGA
ncbi:hypothetical protein [[Micrococcus luteus] ATCC 49442]|uniref:hypothetical protein n=1 Tax=[Micrococcus luteus] ATCC 49442 TaxID=2698727 RepID=UPI0013DB1DAE|nr:hypothetical protein [[Micrococcus luteus] ATCC 49442]